MESVKPLLLQWKNFFAQLGQKSAMYVCWHIPALLTLPPSTTINCIVRSEVININVIYHQEISKKRVNELLCSARC